VHEMHPDVSGWPLIVAALTGRAPLLASGALAVAAGIAIAATFAAGWELNGARTAHAEAASGKPMPGRLRSASVR
jgi:type IV secretory pathway TrbL component